MATEILARSPKPYSGVEEMVTEQLARVERIAEKIEALDRPARILARPDGSNDRVMAQIECVAEALRTLRPKGFPIKKMDSTSGLTWWESLRSNEVEGSSLPYPWLYWVVIEQDQRIISSVKDRAIVNDIVQLRDANHANLRAPILLDSAETYLQ